ncbi:MAG: TSUP family transporter [Deltaproteobacteria bacterium]|nr:TSUP family transporter [Deltaproteobacteria bacterium]
MHFPVSGVDVFPIVPVAVAFCVSFCTSMGGISGAFLLLPFQVSVLGFVSPAVSPTNLVYNIVAIPSGVYRYIREGRMAWPLTWVIIVGTLPGVFIGAILRVKYLPDPRAFKLFVGCVLLYIGVRLLYELTGRAIKGKEKIKALDAKFKERAKKIQEERKTKVAAGLPPEAVVRTVHFSFTKYEYEFYGETFSFNSIALFALTFVVGIIGGTYGIGGGAIIAPFLIAVFGLPVYTIAGAALMGTFLTSIAGVVFYSIIAPMYAHTGLAIAPDWLLGFLFGVGGFAGMYCGARVQKFVPQKVIKLFLGLIITLLAGRYILQYFT